MDTYFTHLHCHSNFSLLDGVSAVEAIIDKAVRLGMKHCALTDRNNLYGSVVFYEKSREKGIHPIIGSEVMLSGGTSVVLLVKDNEGYKNLCEIITEGNLRGGHLCFSINERSIFKRHRGLIALSGGKKGRITRLVLSRDISGALDECRRWKSVFGDDFYIEMQYHTPADRLINYKLNDVCRTARISPVCTNDVHFTSRAEFSLWKLLRAIDENTTISRVKIEGSDEQYMKPVREMKNLFARYPDAVHNTQVIAKKCRFEYSLNKPVFPKTDVPVGKTPYSILRALCYEGAGKLYDTVTDEIEARLEYELEMINELGYTEYFLIVKDIADYARREGIPCVGRGSAGDSIVSYTLGITQMDPVRYGLYFERFLNRERREPPDIDLDLCWRRRDEVIDYVYRKYGHDKTAMICTFATFGMRSSIADVGKAHGLSEEEVRTLTKALPHRNIESLEESIKKVPECRDSPLKMNIYRTIISDCKKISGFPRHLSIHPGGVIIAPESIMRYTPLEKSRKGTVISQHDMYSAAKLGLVKMDLLGVRSLSVVSDCLRSIGRKDFYGIAEDDMKTIEMIRGGGTIGCFQLESPAMRGLLKKMVIQNLDDIIAAVALIRPGPSEGGMKDLYIRRRAGVEGVEYIHPFLEPILKDTYGIIVYQEQVLQVANKVAGLSYGEADVLRRVMTKKKDTNQLKKIQEKFIEGAKRNGLYEKDARTIWSHLSHFAGYGFNKAHSAAYGFIAYQSGYLKRHYPREYMTAVLNNGGGFYAQSGYIEECRRLGFIIKPPDVNRAEAEFTSEGKIITAGLSAVSELTKRSMNKIISERKKGFFTDVYDLIERCSLGEKEVNNLIRCGALRSLEDSEPNLIVRAKVYFQNKRKKEFSRVLTEGLHFSQYTIPQRIANEFAVLGFSVSGHPLNMFPEIETDRTITCSSEVEKKGSRRVKIAGWVIAGRRANTKSGEHMRFLTVEDKTGVMECVLFPKVYREYGALLGGCGPFFIMGTVQSRVPGEANIIVEKMKSVRITDDLEKTGVLKNSHYFF